MQYYCIAPFAACQVYRGGAASTGVVVSTPSPEEYFEYTFLLTTQLAYRNHVGEELGVLPVGTKVKIPSTASAGASFPYMIQAVSKMFPDSNIWEYLDPDYSYGFLDLGFEYGTLPSNRSLITGYMD